MTQGSKEELFRDRLKDIILHKDQLEDHFLNALQVARSKEDLVKLNVTITKLERLLNELKEDIGKRITIASGATPSSTGASSVTPIPPNSISDMVVNQQQYQPFAVVQQHKLTQNDDRTPAKVPAQILRQERPKEAPPQNTRVFSKSSDWHTFRKNPNLPDVQRLYIPLLGPESTEESLYKFFSQHGRVLDVKMFPFPNGRPKSAAVGFDSVVTVKNLLPQKFFIDGRDIYVRQYYTKDNSYNYYAPLLQRRYQVFCGGIPARATVDEIRAVIEMYGKVRDVRAVYAREGDGSHHRGFAYIDMAREVDAQYLISQVEPVYILGKEVDCKANTRPLPKDISLSSSVVSLADALPEVPPLPNHKLKTRTDSSTSLNSTVSTPQKSTSNVVKENSGARMELCIICKKNPQNCVLLWCGHTDTCKECGDLLKNCPRPGCGEKVDSRVSLK